LPARELGHEEVDDDRHTATLTTADTIFAR
jgi:hypothetical protein